MQASKKTPSREKAIRCLEESIRIDSVFPEPYLELAEMYSKSGYEWKAESFLLKGIENGIRDSRLYFKLGTLQLELNKLNESLFHLEHISTGDSLYHPALFLLAKINFKFGNYALSGKLLDSLKTLENWIYRHEATNLADRLHDVSGTEKTEEQAFAGIREERTVTRYDIAWLFNHFFPGSGFSSASALFEDISPNDIKYPVCARSVQMNFLESLPDRKFYPDYLISKRNLAIYLYRWLIRNDFGPDELPLSNIKWKDLSSSDIHYTDLMNALRLNIIRAEKDSVLGTDQPVNGHETVKAFERIAELLTGAHKDQK